MRKNTIFIKENESTRSKKLKNFACGARYIKKVRSNLLIIISRKVDFLSVFIRPKGEKILGVFFLPPEGRKNFLEQKNLTLSEK